MMIDGWKNKGLGPSRNPGGRRALLRQRQGPPALQAYQDRLMTLNACDFGDLLCHPIRIFRAHHDVLRISPRFKYILVDEYQDTNTAQYMWLRLLAQRPEGAAPRPPPLRGRMRRSGPEGVASEGTARRRPALTIRPHPAGFAAATLPSRGREASRHRQHLLRRRRRPVDLWLARRGGRQHPALRQGFSRRDHHPAGAQLPLHRPYPWRRLPPHRPQ